MEGGEPGSLRLDLVCKSWSAATVAVTPRTTKAHDEGARQLEHPGAVAQDDSGYWGR